MTDVRYRGAGTILPLILLLTAAACGRGQPPARDAAAAADSAPGKRITLTPEQLANAGVTLAPVEERAAGGLLEATAEIEPAPNRFAQVGARIAGRITRMAVAEGDAVVAGQTLATIDSPDLGQVTGDYLSAATSAGVAREIADREKLLYERKISSEREWRLAEADAVRSRAAKEAAENRLHALGITDAELERFRVEGHFASEVSLRSPLTGVVASRSASVGKIVQPGEGVFEIVDLREVAIAIDVYEQSLNQVHPGQRAEVRTMSTGATVFSGRVISVGAIVERQTRTTKVRMLLANPDRVLRPGMFATVRVLGAGTDQQAGKALYVPTAAIQRDGAATIVFVGVGPREFERREVEAGPEAAGFTLIRRGVSAGERVVTTGSLAVKSEFRKGTLGEPG